ncbi:hypothetical protein SARC_01825 [Sphaeroforma arctica JP610]|uniref:MATE efflux family protein n=1 Tax=Sphaeroforma arctica JP610 TaxID=667725 RepID=A0A0L0GAL0_9EUKA|nr:hypothetical protein SARC_01825 [Sphaeroforma arctica JP610]KNC86025.1 hypothetical protein SARC_01825 [Sphaeroforma arctica JP610]|eukprot:XP_014159927.1 hypothetical protein SARC_01825 [Sphaeroforma arctica JP610]
MSKRRNSSLASVALPGLSDVGTSETLTYDMNQENPNKEYAESGESTGLLSGESEDLSWYQDIINTWTLSWPIFGTFMLQVGPGITNIIFLGHLEHEALGAGTLATMFIQITGNSIGQGLATAMDTLASQAYGSGQKKKVGVVLQRGLIILNLASIPMLAMWVNTERILNAVGQDPKIAKMAGDFVWYYTPGLWAMLSYEPLKKFLQAQGIVKPGMYVAAFANVWNIFMNWLLIFGFNWGFLGAPVARITTQWMMVFCLLGYMKFTGAGKECWDGYSPECWQKWGQFFKLAIPGCLMTAAEAWAFEAMTLAAGYMGAEYLAAQSIIMQFAMYTILLPFSIGVAGTIRVGQFLGKGDAKRARRSAWAATILAVISAGLVAAAMISLRYKLPRVYSTWDKAIDIASTIIPIVAFEGVFDAVNICGSGVFRGAGKQMTGFFLNLVAYYVIGLPLGFYMGFGLGWKAYGMWMGMLIALMIIAVVVIIIFFRIDWNEEVENAQRRIGDDGDEAPIITGH